jgi:hypothetical protein
MTSKDQSPPDLVIRVALLRGEDDQTELSPSIWRRFRCSSEINLDAFQDKILQPLMGWTRNYHTYYFHTRGTYYYQGNSSSADAFGMHDSYRAQDGTRVNPTEYTLGQVLTNKGDSCEYAYDLGDHWYHKLTLEQVIHKSDGGSENDNEVETALFGKCTVLEGAMCCPDEDGEGGHTYQEQVLDLLNKMSKQPSNIENARNYADACYERHNAPNIRGIFDAQDFSILQTQSAVQDALRSRQSYRMGNKSPAMNGKSMMDLQRLHPGQRKKRSLWQDSRGEESDHRSPFYMNIIEIVNVKPDSEEFAMCVCGNPCKLKHCSVCHTVRYCSIACQKKDWKVHKKVCKLDKAYYLSFLEEKEGKIAVPQGELSGGRVLLRKFDPLNMRFKVGDKVECKLEHDHATGKIIEVLHNYDGIVHAYQVQLDREIMPGYDMIWADWDCDYQIRKVDDSAKRPWSMDQMEIVD